MVCKTAQTQKQRYAALENLNHLRATSKIANNPVDQTLSTAQTVRSAGAIPDHTIRTNNNASINPNLSKPTANDVFIHFTQFSTLSPGTLLKWSVLLVTRM